MKKIFIALMFFSIVLSISSQQVERQMVVLEIATGAWCYYCPGAAMGAEDLVANGHDVAVVEYHNGDPYANNYSNYRNNYYNVNSFPTAFFDGVYDVVGGSHSNSMYNNYLGYYNNRKAVNSSFTMEIIPQLIGSNCDVTVNIHKVAPVESQNMVLHLVLTESDISYNWQGQDHLDFVERTMIPDQYGTFLDFSQSDDLSFEFSVELDNSWVPENCEFVAFIQDTNTKEILQGTKMGVIPVINPISPLEIDFGDVAVGSSETREITVTNYWNSELTGTIYSIPNFDIQTDFAVPPFESQNLEIVFTPTEAGSYQGSIIITTSNENFVTVIVNVFGNATTSSEENTISASEFIISNHPNPFRTSTTISFELSTEQNKQNTISIYNMKGQKIKTLECINRVDAKATKSRYTTTWDGKDDAGNTVNSGIYLLRLQTKKGEFGAKPVLFIK
ncbi:MAG: hypothetical protein DRZ79_03210 [Candidatus Cloacimonadota bacterium]|nr:MAG: hypothetical protein DRZ79_03210 [Candidatus Cloacimonadota bacterium]